MKLRRVAIIGVGYTIPRLATSEVSYRELIYEAAVRAYDEAGVTPKEIDCFTACSEDFNEGVSIFNEYVPDQLGAPLKPVHTITGDGLHGLISAYMQILTGVFDTAVVEAHSKASNIVSPTKVLDFALEPIYLRPLRQHPIYLAALEMNCYLESSGNTLEQTAAVVVKNKGNALLNPAGVYGGKISLEEVLSSEKVSSPLTTLQISQYSDVAVVLVLVSEEKLPQLKPKAAPLWIKGVGWCSETSWWESHNWTEAIYARKAAEMAYKQSGIKKPAEEIDVFEIDDTYAYKELQHLEALKICKKGTAGRLTIQGKTSLKGDIPVNPSGGSLGMGNMLVANGLYKIVELAKQLRGEAGRNQIPNAQIGLAQSWRGLPTTSGAVVILSSK